MINTQNKIFKNYDKRMDANLLSNIDFEHKENKPNSRKLTTI